MKKMEKMFAAIIAATMMSMSVNANAADAPKKSNADASASQSLAIASAQPKDFINGNTKITYGYDAQGRVDSKILYTKSEEGNWVPSMAYQVFFGEDETVLTCAKWNSESKAFNYNAHQVHYSANEYPEIFKAHK